MEKRFFSARNIVYLAVLLALVVVLQAVGGTIPIGVVSLNFTLVPIALGAILFGAGGGAFLGFACGIVVLIQVILGGGFYAVIWTGSPVLTTLTCIVKTTAAGALAGLVYKLIAKKNKLAATFVSAGLVPVINTSIFVLGCLCMSDTLTAEYGISGGNLLVFILVSLVTYNFFIEFAINLLLAPAIHRVISVVEKMIGKKKKKPVPEQSEPVSECDNADEPAQEEILRNEAESEEKTEQ
jgi:uncharacterized membrane protein